MKTIFSDSVLIKKIHIISNAKLYATGIYNTIEYELSGNYYNWLLENSTIFGYGIIDHEKKHITLETIIPDLKNDTSHFSLFLLSTNTIGLSKSKLEKLEAVFGNTLSALFFENHFEKLNTVLNYNEEKLNTIIEKWNAIKTYCLLHIDLIKLGLSAKYIKKVYKTYKSDSIKIIKENPYQMIKSIGFGFKTVDQIALEFGIKKNSTLRIKHAFLFLLQENETDGHTYIEKNRLYEKTKILLSLDDSILFEKVFLDLLAEKDIFFLDTIYVGKYKSYQYELYIDSFFQNNQRNSIPRIEFKTNITLSEQQKKAIYGAISTRYALITGPAGSGKSTIIKTICDIQKNNTKKIIVLTPTGRASQRIKEIDATIETMTIHKALTPLSIYQIQKNINFKNTDFLPYDHLIIDEASMIDSALLYVILKKTGKDTHITFIGDGAQLPPIGIGNPFSLCIEYNSIPIFYVTQIFRQKNNSILLEVAKDISNGIYPKLSNNENNDCYFKKNSKESFYQIIPLYLDSYYDAKNHTLSLQCITFLNRGNVGVFKLNSFIQQYIHKKYKKNFKLLVHRFYIFDKVMVLKNKYDLDIRNGEIGIVIDGDENKIIVSFTQEKKITFSIPEIDILQLAYAINVYKSQGSEFTNILICLSMEQYILLNKKALYTALTRTKNKAILIGESKALYCAINNKKINKRNTFLELFFKNRLL